MRRRGRPAPPARRAGVARISAAGVASLAAILAVLVFVSIPRLRSLAQQENEADAHGTLELFRGALPVLAAERPLAARPLSIAELADSETIAHGLSDGEFLDQGRILRRHGYLFRVVDVAPLPQRGVLAWPWKHAATGRSAFLLTPAGRILQHANVPRLWDGPEVSTTSVDVSGWAPLP
jgi:hypothetical protein